MSVCQLTSVISELGMTLLSWNYIIKYHSEVARKWDLYTLPSTKEEPVREWLTFTFFVSSPTPTGGMWKLRLCISDPPFQPTVLPLRTHFCFSHVHWETQTALYLKSSYRSVHWTTFVFQFLFQQLELIVRIDTYWPLFFLRVTKLHFMLYLSCNYHIGPLGPFYKPKIHYGSLVILFFLYLENTAISSSGELFYHYSSLFINYIQLCFKKRLQ